MLSPDITDDLILLMAAQRKVKAKVEGVCVCVCVGGGWGGGHVWSTYTQ